MCTRKCCNCIEINVNKEEEDRFRYLGIFFFFLFFFSFWLVFSFRSATNSIGDYTEAKIMFDSIAICVSTTKKYFFEYYTASKLHLNRQGSDYNFHCSTIFFLLLSVSFLSHKICAWVSEYVCLCARFSNTKIWPNVANRFFLHSFPVLIIKFDCISRSI